jgi:hypothetical protein
MIIRCTFCGKSSKEAELLITGKLIAGRGPRQSGICNECVDRSMLILLTRKLKEG